MRANMNKTTTGFTLIELLVVIAIIGILAALVFAAASSSRDKADDARIRNDVRQIRWLAEIVYNSQNTSFLNWTSYPDTQANLTTLTDDLQDVGIDSADIIMRDSEVGEYCISVPLKSNPGRYYCTDASVEFKIASGICPEETPLTCP